MCGFKGLTALKCSSHGNEKQVNSSIRKEMNLVQLLCLTISLISKNPKLKGDSKKSQKLPYVTHDCNSTENHYSCDRH